MLKVLSILGQLLLLLVMIIVPCVIGWFWGLHDIKKEQERKRKGNKHAR